MTDENSNQINDFIFKNPDARDCTPDARWGHSQKAGRQIFPGEEEMDGFYYAVLRKNS
jgi:16S rRNA (cytosine967-C5)-methyltransferase